MLHPDFDAALLHLMQPIELSVKAFPACMPKQHSQTLVGESATVSGWGHTQAGNTVDDTQ